MFYLRGTVGFKLFCAQVMSTCLDDCVVPKAMSSTIGTAARLSNSATPSTSCTARARRWTEEILHFRTPPA